MALRLRRRRGERAKAAVDMTSLIDLTFLLLVTFIVTLPALEQGVTILLPRGRADELPVKERKANRISVDSEHRIFFNDQLILPDALEAKLTALVAEDPDVPVHIRGDQRADYASVYEVVKICHRCKVRKMALVSVDDK